MIKFKETESDTLNSNEIISDYHFYIQLNCEEKVLDFESSIVRLPFCKLQEDSV